MHTRYGSVCAYSYNNNHSDCHQAWPGECNQACSVECRRTNLKEASACPVAGNRRPVRTTNSSQIGNWNINVHRCIIGDASGEGVH